ncbi:glycosyltransferase family 4 protein [Klenkia brasiliensis]|nr:glycosyltransferase family 4 protein [Klenkia brasiliensis]
MVGDRIEAGEFSTLILLGEAAGLAARRSNSELIWDKSNVLVSSDLRAVREARGITQRIRGALQAPLAFRFEKRVLGVANQVWVTTTAEHERLAKYYSTPVVEVIPSVFDVPIDPTGFDPESRTLLWMGTLNYGPNWDGLKEFIRTNGKWLDAHGFTVRVVGGGASKGKERWLKAQSMVDYVGYAPELSTALRGARVGIVPILTGAGLKLKTLTFMGYGIPVVSTYQGMEGIPTKAAAALVQSMDQFPAAITNLSSDSLYQASRYARSVAHDKFSTAALGARIDDALQERS